MRELSTLDITLILMIIYPLPSLFNHAKKTDTPINMTPPLHTRAMTTRTTTQTGMVTGLKTGTDIPTPTPRKILAAPF